MINLKQLKQNLKQNLNQFLNQFLTQINKLKDLKNFFSFSITLSNQETNLDLFQTQIYKNIQYCLDNKEKLSFKEVLGVQFLVIDKNNYFLIYKNDKNGKNGEKQNFLFQEEVQYRFFNSNTILTKHQAQIILKIVNELKYKNFN